MKRKRVHRPMSAQSENIKLATKEFRPGEWWLEQIAKLLILTRESSCNSSSRK